LKNERNEAPDLKKEKITRRAAKEIGKKKERQAIKKEKKTQDLKVLYEVDATHLKMVDRNKRILGSVVTFTLELGLIVLLAIFLEYLALPLFILILYFFPSPLILAPSKYKITNEGVVFDGHNVVPLKPKYELQTDQNGKFVSIRRRWKVEVVRLYTPELEKVLKILDDLIKKSEKT
jgi:hypothetical protein